MSQSQPPPDQDVALPFSVFPLCHRQDDLVGEGLLIGEEGKEAGIGSVVQFGHQALGTTEKVQSPDEVSHNMSVCRPKAGAKINILPWPETTSL